MALRHRTKRIIALMSSLSALMLIGCISRPTIGRNFDERVVFIGDSITARWDLHDFFDDDFINKGIEGQTAEQIAARFQSDVIDLKPDSVVILAGTNDVLADGDLALAHDSIAQMVKLADANGIRPIVCTIPPIEDRLDTVRSFNLTLKNDPLLQVSCDYYRALTDADGIPIRGVLNDDGIHPSTFGYVRMTVEVIQVLTGHTPAK